MLNLPVSKKNGVQVMSSIDLAAICVGSAKDAHSDFMKKAKKVLGEDVGRFSEVSSDSYGRDRTILLLPEREACLMAMSYSYELQARVYDAWQAMKDAKVSVPQTYAAALLEAGRLAMELEQSQQQLAIAAPKAEFVDRYVDATGSYTFRQVAKMLAIKENEFREFLTGGDHPVMYRLSGNLTPYAHHVDAGRFIQRAGVADNDHAYTQCRFTAKGVEWIAAQLAAMKARKQTVGME